MDRQHNDNSQRTNKDPQITQWPNDNCQKWTTNDPQNTTQKTKD